MRKLSFAAASMGFLVTASPSIAAPCNGATGRFTKGASTAPGCKAANGKFAKCGTPGA